MGVGNFVSNDYGCLGWWLYWCRWVGFIDLGNWKVWFWWWIISMVLVVVWCIIGCGCIGCLGWFFLGGMGNIFG